MTPQRTAAHHIQRWPLITRRVFGHLWKAYINPIYPRDFPGPRREKPTRQQRRAALGRCARLVNPTVKEITLALVP